MNTLSVFNPLNLVVNESIDCTDVYDYVTTEESYFIQTLNFLSECRKEVNDANKKFYRTVLESDNNYIAIHESFSGFFDTIKNIISKIIEFIKSLVNKFITKLHSAIKSEKYLVKHKEDFRKFGSNHEFKFDGYNFTFPAGVPVIDVLTTFATSMTDLDLDSYTSASVPAGTTRQDYITSDLKAKYDKLMQDLDDRFYDGIRAQTLGRAADDYIYQSDYANDLFTLFRGDSPTKEEIDVTSSKVTEFYDRFDGSKKFETAVKKDKDRIEKAYASIKKSIDGAVKRSADGKHIDIATGDATKVSNFEVNNDMISVIDLFIKAKSNQIQEISNIHVMAFSAKLDAISDCFKQDKSVLYQALSKVQGMKKEDK